MICTIKEGNDVNLYAAPDTDAMIICRIPAGTRVEVDLRRDLGKFCVVYTSMGAEGFCMRKHIKVEQ